jgi:hypothetical protein
LVDSTTEVRGAEEGLQEGVHVTGGSLILQSDEAGLLLRVVATEARRTRCVSEHFW